MARKLDEYQPFKFYQKRGKRDDDGFVSFDDGERFYFARYLDGKLALISQSYQSAAGRDNGIQSVIKNSKLPKRYKFDERGEGKHGFGLIAGNHQEIGVSVNYPSRKAAENAAGRMNGTIKVSPKAKAAPKVKAKPKTKAAFTSADGRRGNYKPLAFYVNHGGDSQDGFDSFDHDGASYFSYRKDGDIYLISESYTSSAGRDNGIKSVTKNMPLEARYKHRRHKNGQSYFDLMAGNHQEIATSVWFDSDDEAKAAAASLRAASLRHDTAGAPVAALAAAAAGAAAASAAPSPSKAKKKSKNADKTDDYLQCEDYQGHPITDEAHKVAFFTHENGLHYFVFYDDEGEVKWRSEGFADETARQIELELALHLHDNPDNIKRLSRGDRYIDMLHDDTGREIARSCLCTETPVAAAPLASAGAAVAAAGLATIGAGAAAATVATAAPGASVTSVENLGHTDGGGSWRWLKWLLLALLILLALALLWKCTGERRAISPVVMTAPATAMVTCDDGSEALSLEACPVSAPVAAAPAPAPEVPVVTTTPMVICWNGSEAVDLANCPVEPQINCWDGSIVNNADNCPVDSRVTCWDGSRALRNAACPARPAPVPAAAPQAGLFPFFAPAEGSTATIVTRQSDDVEFGDSHGLTPAEFHAKLAGRYAVDTFDKNYLDALFRRLGYPGGFADVDASIFGEATIGFDTEGLLGYGEQHGIEHVQFRPEAARDQEAFSITGANGRTIYYMKTCGNYFFPL